MQRRNLFERLRPVNLNSGNDFGASPQHHRILGAVGGRGVEQITVFGAHAFGVTVRDGREQQEPPDAGPISKRFS